MAEREVELAASIQRACAALRAALPSAEEAAAGMLVVARAGVSTGDALASMQDTAMKAYVEAWPRLPHP